MIGQLIEVEPGESALEIAVKLQENSRFPDNTLIRYQAGKRWIIGWSEMKVSWEVLLGGSRPSLERWGYRSDHWRSWRSGTYFCRGNCR